MSRLESLRTFFVDTLPKFLSLPISKKGPILHAPQSNEQGNPQDIVPLSGTKIVCRREDRALLHENLSDLIAVNPQTGKNLKKINRSSKTLTIVVDPSSKMDIDTNSKAKSTIIHYNPNILENSGVNEPSYMPAIRLGTTIDKLANPKKPEHRGEKPEHAVDTYRTITTSAWLVSKASSGIGASRDAALRENVGASGAESDQAPQALKKASSGKAAATEPKSARFHDSDAEQGEGKILTTTWKSTENTTSKVQVLTNETAGRWISVQNAPEEIRTGELVKGSVTLGIIPDVEAIISQEDSKDRRYGTSSKHIFSHFKSADRLGFRYDPVGNEFIITPYDAMKNPQTAVQTKHKRVKQEQLSVALEDHLQYIYWAQNYGDGLTANFRTDAKNVTHADYKMLRDSAKKDNQKISFRFLHDDTLFFERPEVRETKSVQSPPPEQASSQSAPLEQRPPTRQGTPSLEAKSKAAALDNQDLLRSVRSAESKSTHPGGRSIGD